MFTLNDAAAATTDPGSSLLYKKPSRIDLICDSVNCIGAYVYYLKVAYATKSLDDCFLTQ